MATAFGADLAAARVLSHELRSIRGDLGAMSARLGDPLATTGSPKVAAALHRFLTHTSDQRAALGRLLDRASGLLDALVDGATQVDTSLASALPVGPSAGTRAKA